MVRVKYLGFRVLGITEWKRKLTRRWKLGSYMVCPGTATSIINGPRFLLWLWYRVPQIDISMI